MSMAVVFGRKSLVVALLGCGDTTAGFVVGSVISANAINAVVITYQRITPYITRMVRGYRRVPFCGKKPIVYAISLPFSQKGRLRWGEGKLITTLLLPFLSKYQSVL